MYISDVFCIDWEVNMAVWRVEAFLQYIRQRNAWKTSGFLTGKTIRSGFLLWACRSPAAALRIISRACFKLSILLAPMFPSWINARLNALRVGGLANMVMAVDAEEVPQFEGMVLVHVRGKVYIDDGFSDMKL